MYDLIFKIAMSLLVIVIAIMVWDKTYKFRQNRVLKVTQVSDNKLKVNWYNQEEHELKICFNMLVRAMEKNEDSILDGDEVLEHLNKLTTKWNKRKETYDNAGDTMANIEKILQSLFADETTEEEAAAECATEIQDSQS